jgi:hypothetical protein
MNDSLSLAASRVAVLREVIVDFRASSEAAHAAKLDAGTLLTLLIAQGRERPGSGTWTASAVSSSLNTASKHEVIVRDSLLGWIPGRNTELPKRTSAGRTRKVPPTQEERDDRSRINVARLYSLTRRALKAELEDQIGYDLELVVEMLAAILGPEKTAEVKRRVLHTYLKEAGRRESLNGPGEQA